MHGSNKKEPKHLKNAIFKYTKANRDFIIVALLCLLIFYLNLICSKLDKIYAKIPDGFSMPSEPIEVLPVDPVQYYNQQNKMTKAIQECFRLSQEHMDSSGSVQDFDIQDCFIEKSK